MSNILLARIDDRLIHGQVMTSWVRFVKSKNILIIDDFMANGCAAAGLCEIVEAAHANVAGIGIVIEKGFQHGGAMLRDRGYRVESLAIVEEMDPENQTIRFRDDD